MPEDTAQHHHHQHQHDQPHLSTKALAAWETIAGYWDRTISRDGNNYWQRLQEPCLARFLPDARVRGCKALDLATGNGLVARWLVARGARRVLATDGSENMIRIARGYWEAAGGGVSGEGAGAGAGAGEQEKGKEGDGGEMAFRVVDVTREEDLRGLVADGKRGFDVIVMNMAIMDVATIEPLAKVLSAEGGLLAKDGVFVATLLHPVFFTSGVSRIIEVRDNHATGEIDVFRSKVIKEYLHVRPAMGIAVPGQPVKQVYFHRSMHELFSTFFRAGLVMDAMEELAFTEEDAVDRVESNQNYTQLPSILAFRMRLP